MRRTFVLFVSIFVLTLTYGLAQCQDKAPDEIVFKAKMGDVRFPHAKHAEREKKCESCHTKIFEKDSKVPLNYKPAIHKTAEKNKTSCATCHVAGGTSFETKGNCVRCHKKR